MSLHKRPQLDLFGNSGEAGEQRARPVLPAEPDAGWIDLAARLPAGIFLGTSSWHFPGWARLVYDRPADERVLAREGLRAYSQHPLLKCAGIDRTFYAPLERAEFEHYADQVPHAFRFVVKAPMLCTAANVRSGPGQYPAPNPRFLDAAFATQRFVRPCIEGLGAKAAVLVFQFPPLARAMIRTPEAFAERLHVFLDRLPRGPRYAVELRDAGLLTPAYVQALRATSAIHCLGLHPRMPFASAQARLTGIDQAGPLVVRWNLHAAYSYEAAKARYAPFDRLVDEDLPGRVAVARLCLDALARGEPAFVIANNKAEGSAPLTLFKLAEQIEAHLPRSHIHPD